ncbi:MAG: hypothetical protein OJF62_000697 [Pseudolabrys sp.]|nr:hypothetical protein [Pseudolabrys sp.]
MGRYSRNGKSCGKDGRPDQHVFPPLNMTLVMMPSPGSFSMAL